jgi:hypothetical protein
MRQRSDGKYASPQARSNNGTNRSAANPARRDDTLVELEL